MPQPDETLDFPPYQPPKCPPRQGRFALIVVVLLVIGFGLYYTWGFLRSNWIVDPWPDRHFHIDRLQVACAGYRLDNGTYPWPLPSAVTPTTTISTGEVCAILRGERGGNQIYLGDIPKKFLRNGTVVDRWGHEIMIRVDPATMKPVVWSCGPDGKDDTNDGESPDPAKFPKSYYWFGKGDTGDDIVSR